MDRTPSNVEAAPARNNAETLARYVVPPTAFNFIRNVEQITRLLMSFSSITLDCFVRKEFGERHYTIVRVAMGWLMLQFFLMLANLQNAFSWVPGIQPLASERGINRGLVLCFLALSLVHIFRIWQRNHAGIVWHSHSWGISHLSFLMSLPALRIRDMEFRITDWALYRYLEPGLCLLISWYLIPGPSFTRNWLIWCSLAMLIHNNQVFFARRTRFLDMLDSQIESGYYNTMREEATGASSKYQTAGHTAMPLPPQTVVESMQKADIELTVRETTQGLSESA